MKQTKIQTNQARQPREIPGMMTVLALSMLFAALAMALVFAGQS